MKLRLRAARAALVVLSLLAGLPFTAMPASAGPTGCLPDVGKKMPVLFVHGFNAGQNIWGDAISPKSFIGRTNAIPNIEARAFDYKPHSLQWVTDPSIGPKLAAQITCMAASSRQQGGQGKVVVVAHSMGGLATRQAIAESPDVAKSLGLVVTIATPNTGSNIDRQLLELSRSACAILGCGSAIYSSLKAFGAIPGLAAGSKELKALPDWPKGLPVYAMAGNITPRYNLFGLQFDGPPSKTDTLVTTASALHGTASPGGKKEFGCTASGPILVFITGADCDHGALIDNGEVQSRVVNVIKSYLAAAQPQRKLPEVCSGMAIYQGSGYTLKANATVISGTVTCSEAVKLAQAYLEKAGPTTVGPWTCQVTSNDSRGFIAECTGPQGKVRLSGE